MTTGPIMPINCIFLVEIDCGCEVLYCFLIFKESIPDQASPVKSGGIFGVKLNYFVKVF